MGVSSPVDIQLSNHGVLNYSPSLPANPSLEDYNNYPPQNTITTSESSLNPSTNEVPPQKSFTIPSSDASRFEPQQQWPPTSINRQLPIEPSDQPQISFQDFNLFPTPTRPVERAQPPRTVPSHLGPTASPNGVDNIIHNLGYSTSSSQFSHRPIQQTAHYQQRAVSQSLYRQHQQSRVQASSPQTHHHHHHQYRSILPENMKEEELNEWLQVGDGSAFSSPALGVVHDPNVSLATVSPHDIFYPHSTPMSSLMSPLFDGEDSSYDTSPMYAGDEEFIGDTSPWPSLFPEEPFKVEESPAMRNQDFHPDEVDRILRSPEEEYPIQNSSASTSPQVGRLAGRKASATHGIRKRTNPLPPIIIEDKNDVVAVKRARNTLAARKSREKKVQRMQELEDEIVELKAQLEHWKAMALKA